MDAFAGKRILPVTVLSQARSRADEPPPNDAVVVFKHVFESIRQYKRFIIGMIGVGALLAATGSLLMSPSYLATAQLVVSARGAGGTDSVGQPGNLSAPTGGSDDPTIDTHVTVMSSDAYLRRLLPALRVLDSSAHGKANDTLFRSAWSKMKGFLSFRKDQPSDGAAVAALKGRVRVSQERRSRVISVIASDPNPQRAADVANLVARSYADELARQKRTVELQVLDAIAAQSANVQRDLSMAKAEWEASHSGQASSSQSAALEWRITTLAQQYETLIRKRQDLTTKGVVAEPDVTVIADASPPDLPGSLNPFLLVPPITIVFALLACLLAVVLKRLDRSLHTEAEAAEALGIPCVGLIRSIPLELSTSPRRFVEEWAIPHNRAVRSTVVSLMAGDPNSARPHHVVLVTSSLRGEGKSAIAWSFGFCAAQLGQRVLFLDFAPLPRRAGGEAADLFRLLTHDGAPAKAVQHISELGIDYILSRLSEGSRLGPLTGPNVATLFDHFRNTYDLVVINAPSLDDAPEVRLLASWADHVLLAVRAGSTSRDIVRSTLSRFGRTSDLDTGLKLWCVLTQGMPGELAPSEMEQPSMSIFRLYCRRLKHAVARWLNVAVAITAPDNDEPGWRPRK
ncbi:hypothetical protein [Bradyrhizobium cosmicum]|uniref:hypothetical protein n=1 Tax=Bradyrhizobium cosmicum TaxID=1404864 RepID=UPI0028E8ADD4|nr:hypothetical protein [Bradyrhizobium cosmicum]